ncbi:MAG: (d)CMP kinase [Peptococcaceae bacterium]|nr:(d)CMP kinase [Peptococcaceae bacterium]
MKPKAIAIDGPAGSGKSTVAREVAKALQWKHIDTGAMYRAVTYLVLKNNIDLNNIDLISSLVNNARMEISNDPNRGNEIFINGENVTKAIREPLVTKNVSSVSSIEGVRLALVSLQRILAAKDNVVMEGRDIGSVVLPEADYKFYITASSSERALRRSKDLEKMGFKIELDELQREIEARDHMDSTRAVNPLKIPVDATVIDCTAITAKEVVNLIVNKVMEESA